MNLKQKLLLSIFIAGTVIFGFFGGNQQVEAQTCSGTGSDSYPHYQCGISGGAAFCQVSGSDFNSGACGFNSGLCSFSVSTEQHCSTLDNGAGGGIAGDGIPDGCFISNQCAGGGCYDPNGCTYTPAPTSAPAPTTVPTAAPTTPPGCSCTWSPAGTCGASCNGSTCGSNQKCYTASCSPVGCSPNRCQDDSGCGATPVPTAGPTDNAPIGYHGIPNNAACTLNGWTCDPDLWSKQILVDFWILGSPNVFVGETTANKANEAAVTSLCGNTSNHRFDGYVLPSIYWDGAPHTITAFGIGVDSSGANNGNNPQLNTNPQTITCNNVIGGRIVSCANTSIAIPGVSVDIYDDAKKLDATVGHSFPATNANGYFTTTYVNRGNVYAVRPPATPPSGYQGPPKARGSFGTNPMGWTWTGSADTALNAPSYELQTAGTSDCGGNSPNGDDRCSFCYDLCVTPVTPPVPTMTSACIGNGANTAGTAIVSWTGGGTYDILRNTSKSATGATIFTGKTNGYNDTTALCGNSYYYGLRTTNACGSNSAIDWSAATVYIKCNPTTPSAPAPTPGSYNNITIGNWTAGDLMYRASPGVYSTPPAAPAVPAVLPGGSYTTNILANPDANPACDDITATSRHYHFYAAKRSRGVSPNTCSINSPASPAAYCYKYPDWFLTAGGDVTSNSNIGSQIPSGATIKKFADGIVLGTDIDLSFNGTNTYGTATYQVQTDPAVPVADSVFTNNNYSHLFSRVQSKGKNIAGFATTPANLATINGVGSVDGDGWKYVQYTGASPLTLSTSFQLANNQKIMLFVPGDVIIKTPITGVDTTSEFVLIASGNITVTATGGVGVWVGAFGDPSAAARTPDLTGLFMTDKTFDTGVNSTTDGSGNYLTLKISGSVIALQQAALSRNSTGTYPKTFLTFRPEFIANLPSSIKESTSTFAEVAP